MLCACLSLNQTHFLNHLHYDSVCAGFVAAFILVRHFIELDGRHSNQSHFDLLTTVVRPEAFLLSKTCDNTGVGYLIDRRESQGAFQRLLSSDQFQNVAKSCNYSMVAAGDYTMVATTQTRNH